MSDLPEPFSTPIQLELPPSIFARPRISELQIQREPIGYFNRIGPSEGSDIWRIEPCK
jgi:hypothetical protein